MKSSWKIVIIYSSLWCGATYFWLTSSSEHVFQQNSFLFLSVFPSFDKKIISFFSWSLYRLIYFEKIYKQIFIFSLLLLLQKVWSATIVWLLCVFFYLRKFSVVSASSACTKRSCRDPLDPPSNLLFVWYCNSCCARNCCCNYWSFYNGVAILDGGMKLCIIAGVLSICDF